MEDKYILNKEDIINIADDYDNHEASEAIEELYVSNKKTSKYTKKKYVYKKKLKGSRKNRKKK